MAIEWGLAGKPLNGLEALQYYGQAQQDGMQRQKLQAEQAKRAAIGSAYDPQTGAVNSRQVERALIESGDVAGYREYHKSLQGEQLDAAKVIGQLALQADTPEKWDQSIAYLEQHGVPGISQYKGQFSEQNRMAALALGGLYDDYRQSQEAKYIPVGENGVVNVRDPAALARLAASQGGGAASAPPATLPPDFDFDSGGPASQAPGGFPRP